MPSRRNWQVVSFAVAAVAVVTAVVLLVRGYSPWAPRVVRMLPAGETLVYVNFAALRQAGWPGALVAGIAGTRAPSYATFVAESGFDFEHDLDALGLSMTGNPDQPGAATVVLAGRFGGRFSAYLQQHATSRIQADGVAGYRFPGWARPDQPITVVPLDASHILVTNAADPAPAVSAARRWWPRESELWQVGWTPPVGYIALDAQRLAAERDLDGSQPPWQGTIRVQVSLQATSGGGVALCGYASTVGTEAASQLLAWAQHALDTWRSVLPANLSGQPPAGPTLRALLDQLAVRQDGSDVSFALNLNHATLATWENTLASGR